jgi:hypothetical protein
MNNPTLCLNFSDFARTFADDSTLSDIARQVRLFFANGGTQCYVMRIASGATQATVKLKNEAGTEVLILTANNAGLVGETVRAAVTYSGQQPEANFNIELFRWQTQANGQLVKADQEVWTNLSMDPLSSRFAPAFLTQNSKLASASIQTLAAQPKQPGLSQSGRPVAYVSGTPASIVDAWKVLVGNGAGITTNRFQISVGGTPYVEVNLQGINVAGIAPATFAVDLANAIKSAINAALPLGKTVNVQILDGPPPPAAGPPDKTSILAITSTDGDVFIRPATTSDLAVSLMLGTDQGGLEVSSFAKYRPAPTGITFNAPANLTVPEPVLNPPSFPALEQRAFSVINFGPANVPLGNSLQTATPTSRMYTDGFLTSSNGHNDGVREKFGIMATAINNHAASTPGFNFKAEVWGSRLAIISTGGGDNDLVAFTTGTPPAPGTAPSALEISGQFTKNVRYYSLGKSGTGSFQTPAGSLASDGGPPTLLDYSNAYAIVDKEVDLFNLLVLPADAGPSPTPMRQIWGPASIFCDQRRAFLLMDPPPEWTDIATATSTTVGVNSLRTGLVKDHSAVFFPRLVIDEGGLQVTVGPTGAIAGLMARIDSSRGVWKAPAGTEADIRGITKLDLSLSDGENGVLNPKAINTLRVFTVGTVNWGARTMDGDDDFGSEYKYIPVRRLALYIEESLYRGTKWVVFEPNDEPLWAQIRLNVGAFMHDLFRKGAFQGTTPKDAYLVKCDSETTTQNDINQGIVNILVGFAPLKPAEFVIIQIQQLAGQIQV